MWGSEEEASIGADDDAGGHGAHEHVRNGVFGCWTACAAENPDSHAGSDADAGASFEWECSNELIYEGHVTSSCCFW